VGGERQLLDWSCLNGSWSWSWSCSSLAVASENLDLESENLELESENLELESENLELELCCAGGIWACCWATGNQSNVAARCILKDLGNLNISCATYINSEGSKQLASDVELQLREHLRI